jgi:hypothetical protein
MTTISRSNVRTGVSTQLHMAMPRVGVPRPPAYGVPFALATVLLSLLGVGVTYDLKQESSTADVPFAARE